jgi:hypothetical protein
LPNRELASTWAPRVNRMEMSEVRPRHAARELMSDARRLLLVSYYYPPVNVVGSLRWQKLSAALAQRNWVFDVVMVDPKSAGPLDPLRLSEIPADTRLHGVPDGSSPLFELQRSAWRLVRPLFRRGRPALEHAEESSKPPEVPARESISRAYLSQLMFREMLQWAERATPVARRVAAQHPPELIVSSGPPHSAHEVARRVAKERRVPFVMDMRDPWCAVENMPKESASRMWMRLADTHERRCVEDARLVVVTTEAARVAMCERYPNLTDRFITVMNGADPENIPTIERNGRFVIAYAGNLYFGRDPRNLFRAVARVAQELRLSPDALTVQFLGGDSFEGRSIAELATEAGAEKYVVHVPSQPRMEALKLLAGAAMLVNLPQYAHLAIPAKVFEYVQFDAWLLVLAERDSATELLFRDSGADVVRPDDVEGIASVIRNRFEQFRRGDRPIALNQDGSFSRDRQAKLLMDALDRL